MTKYLDKVFEIAFDKRGIEISNNDINLNKESGRFSFDRKFRSKISSLELGIKNIERINKNVEELLNKEIPRLENRVNDVVNKLRGAILVERNTTSTIYSTIIPINTQYTDPRQTTAIMKDNVIFGISDNKLDSDEIKELTFSNVIFKNVSVKKFNKDRFKDLLISNLTHNSLPFEFTINLNGLVNKSSVLVLNLKDYAILEVYKDNVLYQEKSLTNNLNIPLDMSTEYLTIRSYPTLHKSSDLYVELLGITDLIYQEEVVYTTKEISIGQNLTHLVLDTCDNTDDSNVSIDYYMSFNEGEFEVVNTTRSTTTKETIKQSVIGLSKDKELTMLPLVGTKESEGNIVYVLPNSVQNQINFEVTAYIPNINRIKKKEIYVLIKNDIQLVSSIITDGTIHIDDNLVQSDEFLIPKGIRKMSFETNYNYTFLEHIIGKGNIFSHKITKPIFTRNDVKYISLNSFDLLEAHNDLLISDILIKDVKQSVFLNTLKVKAVLRSNDFKTVPYISRFLIRGI